MRVSAAALPRFPPPGPGPRGPSSAPGYSPASPPSSPLPARLGPAGRGVPSLRCHGGAPSMPCSALPSPFFSRGLGRACRRRVPAPSPLSLGIRISGSRGGAWLGWGAAREPLRGSRAWAGSLLTSSSSSSKGGSEWSCLPPPRAWPRCAVQVLFGHRFSRSCEGSGAWRSLARLGEVGKVLPGFWLQGWSPAPSRSFLLPSVTGRVGGVVQQVFPPLPLESGSVWGTKFLVGLMYPLEPVLRGSQGTFAASQELCLTNKDQKTNISTDAEKLKQLTGWSLWLERSSTIWDLKHGIFPGCTLLFQQSGAQNAA